MYRLPRPSLSALAAPLLTLTLMAACGPEEGAVQEQVLVNRDTDSPGILGLERLGEGPLLAGNMETFHARLAFPEEAHVAWRSSGGHLETDGSLVRWQLPEAAHGWLELTVTDSDDRSESARFHFGLTWLSNDARGAIPHPDTEAVTGVHCDLAIDGSDRAHVVYRDATHPSLWYARWSGSAWQVEMIDGMGFGVGGRVGGAMSIVTDGSGNPHVAYLVDGRLSYATRSGSGPWTIEQVDTDIPGTTNSSRPHAISLDPANGNRPTVVYSQSATPGNPVIAYRTGPGAWTNVAAPAGTGEPWRFVYTAGGLVFDGGTAYFTVRDPSSLGSLGTWSASAGFSDPEIYRPVAQSNAQARIALDSAGSPIVIDPLAVWHVVGSDWRRSNIAAGNTDTFDIAHDGTRPHAAINRGGTLELVTTDSRSYWTYTYIGSASTAGRMGIAIDGDGTPRVCYASDNRIHFY